MVFVDVSGFTVLTDRLAARGKAGVEEITDVVGKVFGPLLDVAASYGADLLKWGGDAVLLYFAEPDSAARACRAAMLMSRTMSRIGRLKTSAGRLSLRVSVGVHSGSFDLYLLGYVHRELIVTGPAVTVTTRMEMLAGGGEVVVSQDTASRLSPTLLGESRLDGMVLVKGPRAETIDPSPLPGAAGLDIASLLPADRRVHLLGGGEQAEHRQATVVFLEFSGVDALTDNGGPEAVVAALGPLITATEEAAEWNGVYFHETDVGINGGKIVLLGGVPLVRGNDAERVLRATRDVLSGHPSTSPIRVRAGVNAGRVFVFSHDFGMAQRRVFSVTGDAMNLAARVLDRAGPGQIIATQAALSWSRNAFETEPLPSFSVKGKSHPVDAAIVGAPCHVSEDVGEHLPFVGRDAELSQILDRAAAAADRTGGVVEIVGAPGIGKSRLVSEAADRWPLITHRVACDEYGSATPYLPFRHVMRRLIGLGDDTPHDLAASELRAAVRKLALDWEPFLPLLADVVDVRVPPTRAVEELEHRFRRPRLEHFVVHLLRAYLSAPAALVIEDSHAIDEASASLLHRIVLEARDLPLLVVLTRRPEGRTALAEPVGPHLVVELQPLAEEAAARMAGGGAASPLTPRQVDAIVERAGGNPLFLRELLRSTSEAGDIEELPESLEPLLVAQIDRLTPPDRQVLRAAAVLGTRFNPVVLQDLLDTDAGVDEAVWARLSGFVVPAGSGWQFTHGLIRDAAYEGLSFRRRKELHARAARAIEARTTAPGDAAALLSLHWLHAEQHQEAWRYARLAGDGARVLWANADSATFYARALEAAARLALPPSEVSAVAESLGDVCELTGNYERSRLAYSQARRLAGTDVDRARLVRKTGILHERQGRYSEALSCFTRGRGVLSSRSRAAAMERCELDLASAGIKERQGRHSECSHFATKAGLEARRAHHGSGLAHALYLQHLMSVYLGRPSDELAQQSLAIFEELGDLVGQSNVLNNLGIGAYYQGKWVAALEYYERSRSARLRSGDVVGAATADNNIAEIQSDQGHLDQARVLFESARDVWDAAGYRVGTALATSNLGRLEARAGEVDTGRRLLDNALTDFEEIHAPVFIAETRLRQVECQVLGGDFPAAAAAARQLLRRVRGRSGLEQTEVAGLRLLGTADVLTEPGSRGERIDGEATAALEEAVVRATSLQARYELAMALASRAELVRLTAARSGRPNPAPDRADRSDTAKNANTARADPTDRSRADEIFAQLGVRQAVITWAPGGEAGPLFAFSLGTSEVAT